MAVRKYNFFSTTDSTSVSKLQLTARRVVEGVITGQHKSPHRGFSVEFSEHREYTPGDELRHLDWRAVARSDRYYIKLYEQETNLRATLVLDTSASMKFPCTGSSATLSQPSASFTKFDYARHLTACLAYLLAHQQDLAGLVAVDDSVRIELPAASSPAHLDRLFNELERLSAHTTPSDERLPIHLHALAERLPRRSLVIIMSDFWTNPAQLSKALQHMRYRKHQCMLLHLIDPVERSLGAVGSEPATPDFNRQITLADLETGEKLQIDPSELRETYQREVEAYLTTLRKVCNDTDSEYFQLDTSVPYDKALVRFLNRR